MTDEPADIIAYETREQLVADLKRREYSPDWIREQLEHEDAHFEKACELGYKPKYCLGITLSLDVEVSHRLGIRLDRSASDEDLAQMLTAPKKLSIYDESHLRLLKSRPGVEGK